MKAIMTRVAAILLTAAGVLSAGFAQTRYLADLADVPLPAGFAEDVDARVAFDKPEGRVIRAAAFVADGTDAGSAREFYAETLPALGWRREARREGEDVYVREDERLTVNVEAGGRRVRFQLSPR